MTFPLIAVVLTLLACLVVGHSADSVVRRMRPTQGVPLLTGAALAVSLAAGIAIGAVAVATIAELSSVAADGHWSAAEVRAELSVPLWVGAIAAPLVLVLLVRAVIRTARIAVSLGRAERLCRRMRAGGGPIVMVDDDSADAFTVAGLRGCVVISRRLFTELTAAERQVLTAHELSHLTRRHHLFVHLADIASAANPLLGSVSGAVRFGVERWADEDAATGAGDRRATGQALARVALLHSALSGSMTSSAADGRTRFGARAVAAAGACANAVGAGVSVLGVAALQVLPRVQALLAPAPQRRNARLVLAGLLALLVLALGVASLEHIHATIESATPLSYRATD
jgi:beta-lactamase regulating signal transducer with metallopeptidase domain